MLKETVRFEQGFNIRGGLGIPPFPHSHTGHPSDADDSTERICCEAMLDKRQRHPEEVGSTLVRRRLLQDLRARDS